MKLDYKRGNLFKDINSEVVYLHACNAQGQWGAGIATQFKKIFPKSFVAHTKKINNPGDGYVLNCGGYKVACLITSKYYGQRKDPPKKILVQTYMAILDMLEELPEGSIIYSPKINSGYFATPWSATEKVIIRACEKINKNIKWIVWEK